MKKMAIRITVIAWLGLFFIYLPDILAKGEEKGVPWLGVALLSTIVFWMLYYFWTILKPFFVSQKQVSDYLTEKALKEKD